MGEGGCITTNNFKLSEKIRLNISHGMIRDKTKMINPPKSILVLPDARYWLEL